MSKTVKSDAGMLHAYLHDLKWTLRFKIKPNLMF
jgi:hypothetical protein